MTHEARVLLIVTVVTRHDALDRAFAPLIAIFNNHNFPLWSEAWETYDTCLAAIAREIGDRAGWLDWFVKENDCGRRGHEARAAAWSELRPIRTARDLALLIEADLPRHP